MFSGWDLYDLALTCLSGLHMYDLDISHMFVWVASVRYA